MQTNAMIPASEFCIHHNIELSFIDSLQATGLLQVFRTNETVFIREDELPQLEKMVRLYFELDINLEGIETITYLLQRMNNLQQQILQLNNQLSRYETNTDSFVDHLH